VVSERLDHLGEVLAVECGCDVSDEGRRHEDQRLLVEVL
jgi:hypothetical protein